VFALGMCRNSKNCEKLASEREIETHKLTAKQLILDPQRQSRFIFVLILTFYRFEAIEYGTLDIKI
jgi:hypothetical protein